MRHPEACPRLLALLEDALKDPKWFFPDRIRPGQIGAFVEHENGSITCRILEREDIKEMIRTSKKGDAPQLKRLLTPRPNLKSRWMLVLSHKTSDGGFIVPIRRVALPHKSMLSISNKNPLKASGRPTFRVWRPTRATNK